MTGLDDGEALRKGHAARAHSAHTRAVAACAHAGVDPVVGELVPTTPAGRAAGALRLSARSLDALAGSTPGPAADARCARNASAAAALAAQLAAAAGGGSGHPALRAALAASQAAAAAAGGSAGGRDTSLNAAADDAEERAVAAAHAAGWGVSCSRTRRTDPSGSGPASTP
ncbi:hypothetical protein ACIRPX_27015 [Streptomyces sp. NPDC101225]|uniref:hypothetical protein n=1 Tax=Streptomyces sp. NPDC101225 TaxID=3366135 RepID=UPI0037F49756